MLRKLFRARGGAAPSATIPPGRRVYAIGDIHGRLDLLDQLLAEIDADDAARASAETALIFVGDLVDRGPDSCGVVERLRRLAAERAHVHLIAGNHEEIFLQAIEGDAKALRLFCRVGGRETLLSYGMTPDHYDRTDYDELAALLPTLVPDEHRAFIAGFEDWVIVGDYAFVHAGVRPGVPIEQQQVSDLRWIRSTFLDHRGSFGEVVVHGHTIEDEVVFRPNRIGIDTGAYQSGKLTALGLEGDERWLLQT